MKTVCFGEIMLRLSPPGYERITQAKSFDAYYGGAEAMSRSGWPSWAHRASLSRVCPKTTWVRRRFASCAAGGGHPPYSAGRRADWHIFLRARRVAAPAQSNIRPRGVGICRLAPGRLQLGRDTRGRRMACTFRASRPRWATVSPKSAHRRLRRQGNAGLQ